MTVAYVVTPSNDAVLGLAWLACLNVNACAPAAPVSAAADQAASPSVVVVRSASEPHGGEGVEGTSPERMGACAGDDLDLRQIQQAKRCRVLPACHSPGEGVNCTTVDNPTADKLAVTIEPATLRAAFGTQPELRVAMRNRTRVDLPIFLSVISTKFYSRIFTQSGQQALFVSAAGKATDVRPAACPEGHMWGDSIDVDEALVRVVLSPGGKATIPLDVHWFADGGPDCKELPLPRGNYTIRLFAAPLPADGAVHGVSADLVIE